MKAMPLWMTMIKHLIQYVEKDMLEVNVTSERMIQARFPKP